MKTSSGTFFFILALIVAAGSVLALRAFAQNPVGATGGTQFVLTVTSAKLKNPDDFKKLLNRLDPDGKKSKMHVANDPGKPGEDGPPFKSLGGGATTGPTKSGLAATNAAGGVVGISGVHVTQSITLNDPAELAEVAASFQ